MQKNDSFSSSARAKQQTASEGDAATDEGRVWSRDEVREMLAQQAQLGVKSLNPWRLVLWQFGVACVLGVCCSYFGVAAGFSAIYGGLCVVLPAAVLARGLTQGFRAYGSVEENSPQAADSQLADPRLVQRSAMMKGYRFFVWEAAKIGLTVALLALAPRVAAAFGYLVVWAALLFGFVLTLKVYWIAFWWLRK